VDCRCVHAFIYHIKQLFRESMSVYVTVYPTQCERDSAVKEVEGGPFKLNSHPGDIFDESSYRSDKGKHMCVMLWVRVHQPLNCLEVTCYVTVPACNLPLLYNVFLLFCSSSSCSLPPPYPIWSRSQKIMLKSQTIMLCSYVSYY